MSTVLDKTNALFTHNLLCTSSEENRADLFVWLTLPASLAPGPDTRQSRFLAISDSTTRDNRSRGIIVLVLCLCSWARRCPWIISYGRLFTIEEDTFSIPFRKTKYKTDTPRFRFASSEVIPRFGRSFGQEVSTIIVNTMKYDYYADYYMGIALEDLLF
ncbi:hypothetical protein QLX08_007151 [Tetragonisca angustula]|uniref:Uncharacterized protein n=1 Tax=Tetragonisca angustula TaxID=166442 RepID=A0AAW0ZQR5_9HYME